MVEFTENTTPSRGSAIPKNQELNPRRRLHARRQIGVTQYILLAHGYGPAVLSGRFNPLLARLAGDPPDLVLEAERLAC